MGWSTWEEIKSYYLKKEREKAEGNFYTYTLWLADVKKLYEEYSWNLGYIRKKNAPPRKNRPAVVLDKINDNYKVIFLTTSKYGGGPYFEIENCKYQYCSKDFHWEKISKILVFNGKKGKKARKVFIIKEKDLQELMVFCGTCSNSYINMIRKIL